MVEHSTSTVATPVLASALPVERAPAEAGSGRSLIATLCALLVRFRPACKQQRVYERMVALALAKLAAVGRQTLAQLLLALGQGDVDWSAHYRLFSHRRIDEAVLTATLLQETLVHVPPEAPYVVGVDATHIPRTSRRMPLSGWMRAPGTAPFMRGIQPGQRFVHFALLTPIEAGYSRAIPLRFLPAPVPSAVADPSQAQSETQVAQQGLGWVREQLDANGRAEQQMLVVADGAYDSQELWKQLPAQTTLLVRTARNRHLRWLPESQPGAPVQRGRPRLYGPRAPSPQQWLQQRDGWQWCYVTIRGRSIRLRYRVEGPFVRPQAPQHPLFLLPVSGCQWQRGDGTQRGGGRQRRKEREPVFYLVNAQPCAVGETQAGEPRQWQLPFPVEQLLVWTWQRWELEVAHREMKSGLGVGEMQCWNAHAAALSVQWCVWFYALLVLAAYRCWGLQGGPQPPGRWQLRRSRRWTLNTVWRTYRTELWTHTDFAEVTLRSTANWPKIEQWVQTLLNGMLKNGVT